MAATKGQTGKKTVLATVDLNSQPIWYPNDRRIMTEAGAVRAAGVAKWIKENRPNLGPWNGEGNGHANGRSNGQWAECSDRPDEEQLFLALHACAYQLDKCTSKKSHSRGQCTKWRCRWHRIRDFLVEQNLGLVYTMIARAKPGPPTDDVLSDAQMALVNAVNRFNPKKGYRFSTYACSAIAHALMYRGKLDQRYRRVFPVQHDESFDRPTHGIDRDAELYAERLHMALDENRAGLTDLETEIIDRRFPMGDEQRGMTLRELGSVMGVSKERVRQIQNRALKKLRRALREDPILQ